MIDNAAQLRPLPLNEFDLACANSDVLSPCPFCGGGALHTAYALTTANGVRSTVNCLNTGCLASITVAAASREDAQRLAVARWNRRPIPRSSRPSPP